VWALTKRLVAWSEAKDSCNQATGFVFSAPTNYMENKELLGIATQNNMADQGVWLNLQKQRQKIIVDDEGRHNESNN